MSVVDLIIVAVLLIGTVNGYIKGLIISLLGLGGNLLGLCVAYRFHSVLSGFLEVHFGWTQKLSVFFQNHLVMPENFFHTKLELLPLSGLRTYIENIEIPGALKGALVNYWDALSSRFVAPFQETMGTFFPQYLATFMMNFFSFILIWIMVTLLTHLLARLFTAALKDSPLDILNRLAGAGIGFVFCGIILTVVIGLLNPVMGFANFIQIPVLSQMAKILAGSPLYSAFVNIFSFLVRESEKFLLY